PCPNHLGVISLRRASDESPFGQRHLSNGRLKLPLIKEEIETPRQPSVHRGVPVAAVGGTSTGECYLRRRIILDMEIFERKYRIGSEHLALKANSHQAH